MYDRWKPYVPVAQRRREAARQVARFAQKGQHAAPVVIEGRTIAHTFWGKAWCENLERYSDYSNRLPRGRTYVRNGSVVDLVLGPGKVAARVSGSQLYQVSIEVTPLQKARWKDLCGDCGGAIDSVVELLQGRFARGVMERLCHPQTGLFPAPSEMRFACTCPDWASMCKHVAATLYGVGARLDKAPELFFVLRNVDQKDLIASASQALAMPSARPRADRILGNEGLSELFGLELGGTEPRSGKRKRSPRKSAGTPAEESVVKLSRKSARTPVRKSPREQSARTKPASNSPARPGARGATRASPAPRKKRASPAASSRSTAPIRSSESKPG